MADGASSASLENLLAKTEDKLMAFYADSPNRMEQMDLVLGILARSDIREDSRINRIGAGVLKLLNGQLSQNSGRWTMSAPNQRRMKVLAHTLNDHPNRSALFGDNEEWRLEVVPSLQKYFDGMRKKTPHNAS